jgi:adenine-specific DNA-methyltransferase
VRNDKASELGPFGGQPMDDDGELQRFKRADGGAADDLIDKRSDVFLDVLYDICVIVLRRADGSGHTVVAKTSLLLVDEPNRDLGTLELPARPSSHVWALPDEGAGDSLFQPGLSILGDYGYLAKSGYFVWNREQQRTCGGSSRQASEPTMLRLMLHTPHQLRDRKC